MVSQIDPDITHSITSCRNVQIGIEHTACVVFATFRLVLSFRERKNYCIQLRQKHIIELHLQISKQNYILFKISKF